jgi:hypothetical protein
MGPLEGFRSAALRIGASLGSVHGKYRVINDEWDSGKVT